MADPSGNWMKIRDRLDEDVGLLELADFLLDCELTFPEGQNYSMSVSLATGVLVRLWCIAKANGVRVPETDDVLIPMPTRIVSEQLGGHWLTERLLDAGMIYTDDRGRMVIPNLCRWLTLRTEISEVRSKAGEKGASKREANRKQTASKDQASLKQSASEIREKREETKDKTLGESAPPIPVPAAYLESATEWAAYRRESRLKKWAARTWKIKTDAMTPDKFAEAVRFSIGNGYQGLIEPDAGKRDRAGVQHNHGEESGADRSWAKEQA